MIRAGADSALGLIISLAYPVSDVVVVTIVLFMLARGRQTHAVPMPLILVGAGLVTFAISDSGFAYLTLTNTYNSGAIIDLGWFVGFLLILLAAVKPTRSVGAWRGEETVGRSMGVLLPYVAVLAAVATSTVELVRSDTVDPFVSWNRSVIILLIVGRQVLTLVENRALTRGLEARVAERTAELRAREQRFEALVQHSSDVVTVVDVDAKVIYQSESMARVFGHSANALANQPLTTLLDLRAAGRLREALQSAACRPYGTLTLELPLRRADGRLCQAEITITNLLEDPNVGALVLNTRDITDRKELENQLVHEALHDGLTNLANRALFEDRAQHALRRRDSDNARIAVLFLDLDGFKEVNDSRGHGTGDELLIKVADRLRDSVRPEDTVARFGGDEFAILIQYSEDDEHNNAEAVAVRILEKIHRPFMVDDHELHVRVSIGIAIAGLDAGDPGQLMRNADLAMYRAKAMGEGGYATYHSGMHTALVDRLQLGSDMRRGLEEEQFELYYQPTIDLETGSLLGFEALARWNHPTRGLISPSEFIPLAETTGLIRPLGRWVLREACRQAVAWHTNGERLLSMNVNVSGRQLEQADFLNMVADALADSGLQPKQLCLEMTESVLMNDTAEILRILNSLKEMGIRLAIDDFGTGYSSLSYLHQFPFDILKIDKSFVERLNSSSDEMTLARTIVQLGQGLGITTVAEGLEHYEQFLALRRIGCEIGQGFYFSHPVPADQVRALLEADTTMTDNSEDGETSHASREVQRAQA
ncbi:MAG: bifunctional diguanylate cyclase/phosphodiesterase [Actinomycetota bacterium]|nr:bifunctional diguanylate cyclase/phosphodiesterase [Actinomycetota bacterium]